MLSRKDILKIQRHEAESKRVEKDHANSNKELVRLY